MCFWFTEMKTSKHIPIFIGCFSFTSFWLIFFRPTDTYNNDKVCTIKYLLGYLLNQKHKSIFIRVGRCFSTTKNTKNNKEAFESSLSSDEMVQDHMIFHVFRPQNSEIFKKN